MNCSIISLSADTSAMTNYLSKNSRGHDSREGDCCLRPEPWSFTWMPRQNGQNRRKTDSSVYRQFRISLSPEIMKSPSNRNTEIFNVCFRKALGCSSAKITAAQTPELQSKQRSRMSAWTWQQLQQLPPRHCCLTAESSVLLKLNSSWIYQIYNPLI